MTTRHVWVSRDLGSGRRPVVVWATDFATAVILLLVGISKLAGTSDTMALYEAAGIAQGFRYVGGSIEVMTAVLLLIPSPALVAGIGLALTLLEAGFTNLALMSNGIW